MDERVSSCECDVNLMSKIQNGKKPPLFPYYLSEIQRRRHSRLFWIVLCYFLMELEGDKLREKKWAFKNKIKKKKRKVFLAFVTTSEGYFCLKERSL